MSSQNTWKTQAQFVTLLCTTHLLQMARQNEQTEPLLKEHVLCFMPQACLNTCGQRCTTIIFGCETTHHLALFKSIRPHTKLRQARSLTSHSFRNSA